MRVAQVVVPSQDAGFVVQLLGNRDVLEVALDCFGVVLLHRVRRPEAVVGLALASEVAAVLGYRKTLLVIFDCLRASHMDSEQIRAGVRRPCQLPTLSLVSYYYDAKGCFARPHGITARAMQPLPTQTPEHARASPIAAGGKQSCTSEKSPSAEKALPRLPHARAFAAKSRASSAIFSRRLWNAMACKGNYKETRFYSGFET